MGLGSGSLGVTGTLALRSRQLCMVHLGGAIHMPDIFDCVLFMTVFGQMAERCLEEGPPFSTLHKHLLLAEGCLNSFSLQSSEGFSDNDGSLPRPRGQNASFSRAGPAGYCPMAAHSVPYVHRANIPSQNDPLHQIPQVDRTQAT